MRDRDKQWLDDEEVIRLLNAEVERAGGQTAFARLNGFNRNHLNQILGGRRPIAKRVTMLLKLRRVYIPE
jgi:hypothetical protein